ncbi:hypothetical protein, partial [Neisseria sp. P0014.S002]|uniref:hypothetical protein n=1 Tax=Neisseria sp. P0014.S002 TaxID=3436748 RepID=UPI003F7DA6CE
HLIQLQSWETVDVFCNHGLCGLLKEGAHEKSPKCLGGNLVDFGEFCKGLSPSEFQKAFDFITYIQNHKTAYPFPNRLH